MHTTQNPKPLQIKIFPFNLTGKNTCWDFCKVYRVTVCVLQHNCLLFFQAFKKMFFRGITNFKICLVWNWKTLKSANLYGTYDTIFVLFWLLFWLLCCCSGFCIPSWWLPNDEKITGVLRIDKVRVKTIWWGEWKVTQFFLGLLFVV